MLTKTLAVAGLVAIGALAVSTASASAGNWGYGGDSGGYNPYPATPAYPAYPAYPVAPGYPVYPNYQGGGGYWGGGNGYPSGQRPYAPVRPAVQQVCKPVYKTVQVWKPYYGWVWATVYAGQQCYYPQAYPSYGYGNHW